MLHYRTKQQRLELEHGLSEDIQISKIICLEGHKVWVFQHSGAYQVWNLQSKLKLQEGKISAASKNHTILSGSSIAYLDLSDQKLKILDLNTNEINPRINMDLPTMTARGDSKQSSVPPAAQLSPHKLTLMVEENTQLISLVQSNLLILCEQRTNVKGHFEYIITVIQQEIYPSFFTQFIYTSPQLCLIKPLNKKDSIILWPNLVENAQMSFLLWNVLNKEKGCLSLSFKEPFSGCAVDATSWGSNKIAFWINGSTFSKPEMKILNTKDGQEFKGLIDCYSTLSETGETAPWLLADVWHIDTEKNFAVIQKIEEHAASLDIISLGKFKCSHQINAEKDTQFAFSQDSKHFVQYSQQKFSSDQPLALTQHHFEPFIANTRARAMFLMQQSGATNNFSDEIIRKAISMIYPKPLPQ